MNFKLLAGIAKSLLLARWRQALVAAIGVTFGITTFITLLGFMNGLNHMLDGLVTKRTPHIRIYNELRPNPNQPIAQVPDFKNSRNFIRSIKSTNNREQIYNAGAIIQTIKQDKRALGAAPKVSTQLFINAGGIDIAAMMNGVDVAAEEKLFFLKEYVTAGRPEYLKNIPNSVILGKPLAEKLTAEIGDVIQVTTIKGNRFPLKVVGFYQSGFSLFDKTISMTSVATAQKILGKSADFYTDIQIKLLNMNDAPTIAKEYAKKFGTQAEDIQSANKDFETGAGVRTMISYVVGITLLIVAGFGIFNILNMMIYEKMDSIAIMKATGFSGRDVKKIFLYIALGIGLFGGAVGLLFGFGCCVLVDNLPFKTAAIPTITTFPIDYNPLFYIIAISFSLLTTYLAGLLPARKASRVDPVIIIRGK